MTGKSLKPTTAWANALAYLPTSSIYRRKLQASVVYRAPTHLAAGKTALDLVVKDMGQSFSIFSADRHDSCS